MAVLKGQQLKVLILLLHSDFIFSFYSIPFFYNQQSRQNSMSTFPSLKNPWYSDSKIERDRSHVINDMAPQLLKDTSRFVTFVGRTVLHKSAPDDVRPMFLTTAEMDDFLKQNSNPSLEEYAQDPDDALVLWAGKFNENDYWGVYCPDEGETSIEEGAALKPLRDFGDQLTSETDAAILATANGLMEFHKSHKFCSNCGSKTVPAKAGGCRRCTDCKRSVYPRLDVATIMLITSHCGEYALLGRKANWPKGRYSTLAGFAEVGETLEECCIRETYEESGVKVERDSVHFVASQPWPFPRSLMVGFQATAPKGADGELPVIDIEEDEMDDIQWFSKDYVGKRLSGGSTARDFVPTGDEAEFHIPGKSSLARLLITRWVENTI